MLSCEGAHVVLPGWRREAQQLAQMNEHLRECVECAARFASVQRTQTLVGSLGRKVAPPDLALKLRVAISQEIANSRRSRWERLRVRWENAFNATMVPATAGAGDHAHHFWAADQLPLSRAGARRQRCADHALHSGASCSRLPSSCRWAWRMRTRWWWRLTSDPMAGCRIIAFSPLPKMREAILPQLKNMLIFATFHPATAFGQPTASRVVLTFSKVQVRG